MSNPSRNSNGTTAKSFAAIVKGPAPANSVVSGDSPPVFKIDRPLCLRLVLPPATKINLDDVVAALDKFSKKEVLWQPFIHEGNVLLQALDSEASAGREKEVLLRDGLPVKSITAKVCELINSNANNLIIEGHIEGLHAGQDAQEAMKTELMLLGNLLSFEMLRFPGTRVYSDKAKFLLDISEKKVAPRHKYRLEITSNGGWINTVTCTIIGKLKHCYYCHSTEHLRADCKAAPLCLLCGKSSHPAIKCPSKKTVEVKATAVAPEPLAAVLTLGLAAESAAAESIVGSASSQWAARATLSAQSSTADIELPPSLSRPWHEEEEDMEAAEAEHQLTDSQQPAFTQVVSRRSAREKRMLVELDKTRQARGKRHKK